MKREKPAAPAESALLKIKTPSLGRHFYIIEWHGPPITASKMSKVVHRAAQQLKPWRK